MKIAHPALTSLRLYESEDGIRFRPNSANPKTLWSKLAPVQHDSYWGRIVYNGNYLMLFDKAAPYVLAAAHLNPAASISDIQAATKTYTPQIRQCITEYESVSQTMSAHKSAFNESMDACIAVYYKLGIKPNKLCMMFQVGVKRVNGALKRRGLALPPEPADKQIRSELARAKDAALSQVRSDPRYESLKAADLRARARAKAANIQCSYDRETLLDNSGPILTLPDTCPVFGWALVYEPATKGRKEYANNTASIARYDPLKPYVNGNVLITSRLAARLIDGTLGMAARNKVFEDPALLAAWAAWRQRTGI